MSVILTPVLVLSILGGAFGVLLSIASNVFHVEIDPKIDEVLNALPGVNCGACGFPGCEGLAESIATGKAETNACPVGGPETAEVIANIMGAEAGDMEKEVAVVMCLGNDDVAGNKYDYDGIDDCRIQTFLADGCKTCTHGCVGCGTCQDVCDFGAIEIVNGVAVVDKDKCTSCMKCVDICPKGIIEIVPYSAEYIIQCSSTDMGRIVRGACSLGCMGCRLCVRECPEEAIEFDNWLAKIDYSKCTDCGICAEKCPTNSIVYQGDKLEEKEEAI